MVFYYVCCQVEVYCTFTAITRFMFDNKEFLAIEHLAYCLHDLNSSLVNDIYVSLFKAMYGLYTFRCMYEFASVFVSSIGTGTVSI